MRHTCSRIVAAAGFAGLLVSPAVTANLSAEGSGREGSRPVATKPLPPQATYRGLTSGEWTARWWQESFATLEAQSDPFAISKGAYGGSQDILFLAGAVKLAGSPRVTIPVSIPAGTHLFVPIITVECSVAEGPPFHGENDGELRACANGLLDLATDLHAAIDGRPVNDPWAYRTVSPLFRYGPLTEGNILGLPPATQSDAVAAGYFLLLPPFSVGVHRIAVRANVAEAGLAVDAEFIVYVKPRGW